MSTLELTLLYLLAAVLGVVACRLAKLPPMLGYLVVGVLIGPNALGLAQNSTGVSHLAEFGVVFLMFVIGLEFNLPKLRAMRSHVFGLGLFQVVMTLVLTTGGMLVLANFAPPAWQVRIAKPDGPWRDLFAEGPPNWYFETKASAGGFEIIAVEAPKDATYPVLVTLTLDGAQDYEIGIDLPRP